MQFSARQRAPKSGATSKGNVCKHSARRQPEASTALLLQVENTLTWESCLWVGRGKLCPEGKRAKSCGRAGHVAYSQTIYQLASATVPSE